MDGNAITPSAKCVPLAYLVAKDTLKFVKEPQPSDNTIGDTKRVQWLQPRKTSIRRY